MQCEETGQLLLLTFRFFLIIQGCVRLFSTKITAVSHEYCKTCCGVHLPISLPTFH